MFTKQHTAHRAKHQHQSDSPCDLRILLAELLGQLLHGQRDGEEVECVPRPGQEANQEEHPLLEVEHRQELEGIGSLVHGRLEGGDASRNVCARGHLRCLWRLVGGRVIARVTHLVLVVRHCDMAQGAPRCRRLLE